MRSTLARWSLYLLCFVLMLGAIWIGASLSLEVRPAKTVAQHEYQVELTGHEEPRSGEWPRVRREHLEKEPACIFCGGTKDLQVHHILSFRTHPSLELVDSNLCTVCGPGHHNCHLMFGHLLDFRSDNPDVRKDAAWFREKVAKAKKTQ